MGRITVGLCVLALFASANAFFPLIPEGKELVYNYHGLIRAGSHSKTSYASAFILDGNLHLQTDKNSSFVRFSDLKYKLYNGQYDEWHQFDTKEMDLPKELEVFEHPFKVVYEPCGHAFGIVVESDEPQYSVNVKRGIASILQMYTEKMDWTKHEPYAFHTKEHTLYGKGPYYYTVFPGTDEWTVKKMAEPHSNFHLYSHMSTNSKMGRCDVKYDEPLTRETNQEYTIVKKDGAQVMERVESNADIVYTPYAGEGYAFYIYMNQTMTLEKIEAASAPMTVKSEKFYRGLNYYTADFNTMEGIADIFHGRRTYDQDKMLVELEEMLYDTMKYVQEYHLDMKQPDFGRGQLVNRMLILMYQLDQAHLEAMVAKLMQKTTEADKDALHVFYHMLPMIGSHASYMYMMKLMSTKKIKDKLALEWLQTMPFHVKEPNKMLIDHMSEMLNWGDEISMDVRKGAIMAFGTFLEKAMFRYKKLNHMNNWTGHEDHENEENFTPDHELDAVFPGPKYYEKYITMLGEKMMAEKNIGMRSVYVSAMYNTRMEKAMHYFLPIARGELFQDDNYLRLLVVKGLGAFIRNNDELVYEIFWPIMSNYKLNTNIRVAAYFQIMKTHPNVHRMANLLWQMLKEENYAFYQVHYSYLESISRTTDPCMDDFRTTVKQILRYSEKPVFYGLTGFYEFDFMDTKYEFGNQFSATLVRAPHETETTIKINMDHTMDNAKFPLYGFLIHVNGMEASIFEDVMLYMKDPTKMLNFEKVWKAYKNIFNNKEIDIHIGVTMYGQAIMNYHFDATNIKELQAFMDFFTGDKFNYVKKYFSIVYPMQTNIIMPTEMGFPALFKIYIPKVYFFDIKITKDIVNNMITWQYDTHMKEWVHGRIGLSFYNPIIDMYQGVQRYITFDLVQPLYFDLSFNPTQQSMKLSWKRHDDPKKDAYGIKTYAATFTFMRDDLRTGLLQKSSPESKNWEMVTYGDEHRDTRVLYEDDCSNTGYRHMIYKIDSDMYASNMTIFRNFNYLHYSQNYHTSMGRWLLTRLHALRYVFEQPYPLANGYLMRSEVSEKYPATNIDMNIRFTRDYKRGDMWLFPATKWNMRATYSVKNKDVTMKTWDANLILDSNVGHTVTSFKAIFSRLIPGQKEWRVCVDGNNKHTDAGLEGLATIAMTHSAEPKCTKDEKVMEIKMIGEKLEEQKDNMHMYGECQEDILWSGIHEMNSLDCYMARDTLRKWTYDVKTFNMPTEFKRYMSGSWDWMKMNYMKYITKYAEASMDMEKDSFKIVHEYPMIGDKVNVHVYTPDHDLKFGGIPSSKYPYYNFHMMRTEHFSPMFKFMHKMGWTQVCEISENVYYNVTLQPVEYKMPEDWTMYLGEAETGAKHGIFMKNLKGDYTAMKMVHGEHSLEIIPTGHKTYDIMVDGKKLPENTYQHEEEWVWMDLVKETGVFSIFCMHTGSHMVFDGHQLLHERPNTEMPMYGMCA